MAKIVGILGGMGPMSTADLMRKVTEKTPVKHEREHLRMLVDSRPQIPDRPAALFGNGAFAGAHAPGIGPAPGGLGGRAHRHSLQHRPWIPLGCSGGGGDRGSRYDRNRGQGDRCGSFPREPPSDSSPQQPPRSSESSMTDSRASSWWFRDPEVQEELVAGAILQVKLEDHGGRAEEKAPGGDRVVGSLRRRRSSPGARRWSWPSREPKGLFRSSGPWTCWRRRS